MKLLKVPIHVKTLLILIMFALSCCSTLEIRQNKTPDLLANEKFYQTNEIERESDIKSCTSVADENIKYPNKYWIMGKSSFFGMIIGTVPGALSGTITGDTPESTAAGAAVGAVVGLIQGIQKVYEDNPVYQRFVEHCLHKKGYEIIGWSKD